MFVSICVWFVPSIVDKSPKIGQVPFFQGNVQQFLQDTGKEPYIVSSIGDGGRLINSNFLNNMTVEEAKKEMEEKTGNEG
mgnify:CR=1 FL=1